jgi:hypothetical protein
MRLAKTVFFILAPALAVCFVLFSDRISGIMLIAFYLLTIFYITAYIRKKFEKLVMLPVSFAFTAIPAYIYEELNPSFLISGLELIILLYTLPFTVITTIAVVIVKILAIRKQR